MGLPQIDHGSENGLAAECIGACLATTQGCAGGLQGGAKTCREMAPYAWI